MVRREDAEWVIEIYGVLGVINILGFDHLMVVVGKEEVCRMPHSLHKAHMDVASIYELQEVEIIPFESNRSSDQTTPQVEYQLK